MVDHIRTYGRHEHVDARLWDPAIQQWKSLLPFHKLTLPGGSELSISFGTITLAGDHPCAPELARVRAGIPSPVSFEINGVEWTGQITHAELKGRAKEPSVWVCSVESDHKHLHRMMSRDTAVSAADQTATRLQGWLGEVTRRLVASNAQRTGLPAYVLVEGEGDPVDLEARTEDSVYDVLQDALVGSRMHAEVRMLRPDHDLPGEGVVEHYAGRMERAWEQAELDSGAWPHARTHERLVGKVAPHPETLLPARSWRGEGMVDVYGTELLESVAGICWRPFETVVEAPAEYYAATDPEGIRAASVAELRWLQDEMFTGWSTHVTMWESWQDATDLGALQGAVAAGLVVTPAGTPLSTMGAVDGYVGAVEEVYAWRDGSQWVLATAADFEVEHEKRQPRGAEQRQTPGVLVHLFEERDRRGVVFSSASGGGLEEWSVKHSAPDAAMIIAGAQVDERTLAAAREGILPPSALGTYTPEEAAGILPSGSAVPGTIDRLDVDAQPLASIEGTEVSYSSAGGRADIARVGPFIYREKYLSLSSSGGGDPLHEMTKAWAQSQGMSTMSLTPGASTSAVFGDDVVREDGTVVPGWKPGDRVSFVDQQTRISEVVSGYRLEAEDGRVVSVVPTLGRQEQGVYADLARRLRDAERRATKAQLAPPRRLPEQELIAAAAKEAAEAMSAEQTARIAAIQAEQDARIAAIQAEQGDRISALDAEQAARMSALDAEQAARIAALDAEQAARVAALDAEQADRIAALQAEQMERDAQLRELWDENSVLQGEIGAANSVAVEALKMSTTTRVTLKKANVVVQGGDYLSAINYNGSLHIDLKSGWTGRVVIMRWTGTTSSNSPVIDALTVTALDWGVRKTYASEFDAILFVEPDPGVPVLKKLVVPEFILTNSNTWYAPPGLAFTAVEAGDHTIAVSITWPRVPFLPIFSTRVMVDGVQVALDEKSNWGPLLGNGKRTQTLRLERALLAGQVVAVQVKTSASSNDRIIRPGSMSVTYTSRI